MAKKDFRDKQISNLTDIGTTNTLKGNNNPIKIPGVNNKKTFTDEQVSKLKDIGQDKITSYLKENDKVDAFKTIAQNTIDARDKMPDEGIKSDIEIIGETQDIKQIDTNGQDLTQKDGIKSTGISEIDTELNKLRTQKADKISDTIKQYNIGKGTFEKNKGYYTNFDEVNSQFENILGDLQAIQEAGQKVNEADYQRIANKYGIDVKDVKTPTNVFNNLVMSDEGKQELGVNAYDEKINNLTTTFERNKEDINTNLENQKTNIENQISDTKEQLKRNLGVMEAQGIWSGADRSTGYEQGLENVKSDSQKTITRLQDALTRIEGATEKDIARLTENYQENVTNAKNNLNDRLEKINFNLGLELNEAQSKYGIGSDELSKALDAINEEFGTKSMNIFSQYINNVRDINELTNSQLEAEINRNNLLKTQADQRYNELISNDGVLLQNTTIDDLMQEYAQGNLTINRLSDLQNMMTTGITNVLSQVAPVDSTDLKQIKEYLASGMTPTEVIGEMSKQEKFIGAEEETLTQDWTKLTDTQLYNKKTGEIKDIETGETTSDIVSNPQSIIDYSTNKRGRENLQCGELVNDYVQNVTGINPTGENRMGDTLESKVDALTSLGLSETPVAGGLFVSNPLGNDVGHTGIVQSVNPDGSITVLEANADGLEEGQTPTLTTYTADELENMYFSNSPKGAETTESVEFDTASIPQFEQYLKTGKIGSSATEIGVIKDQFGSIEEFKRQAEAYNNSSNGPKQQEIKKVEEIRDTLQDLINDEDQLQNVSGAVQGGWFGLLQPFDTLSKKTKSYLGKIQNFIDKNTLQNLIDAKAAGATFGALSNEELRMLQNSAQILSTYAVRDENDKITGFDVDENTFRTELNKMLDLYNSKIEQGKASIGKQETINNDPLDLGIGGNKDPLNLGL